jgi:Ni,Fe-hydrogenase III large subunit
VARASGVERDVRAQFPSGIYRFAQIPVSSYHTGSVFARAHVRWMEIQRSIAFIFDQLKALPEGPALVDVDPMAANRAVVSLTEGWRGALQSCGSVLSQLDGIGAGAAGSTNLRFPALQQKFQPVVLRP